MKTFDDFGAKRIGDELGIDWQKFNLNEFTKGRYSNFIV